MRKYLEWHRENIIVALRLSFCRSCIRKVSLAWASTGGACSVGLVRSVLGALTGNHLGRSLLKQFAYLRMLLEGLE